MMHKWIPGALFIGSLVSSSVYGDIRVLFKFDVSGIQALQVVEIAGAVDSDPASLPELPVSLAKNLIVMSWVDGNGEILAVTQLKDPRVASSPEHVNPSLLSTVGLIEGAWVENGPDGAKTVNIEFPENPILGLASESWSVSLRQDK